ncbi:MAG: mechanosensitive ion channel, partial [Bacteroidia bacterium]
MQYLNNLLQALVGSLGSKLPNALGALLVLICGLFLAGIIRRIILKLLKRSKIDERIAERVNLGIRVDETLSQLLYYVAVLYACVISLGFMGLTSVLEPVKAMISNILGYLPSVIAAGIIIFIGYTIASILSQMSGGLSARLEKVTEKAGLNNTLNFSQIIKQLVFVLVFVPIFIVALDTLNMKAISVPAINMLNEMIASIPNILAAAIILGVFYYIGKFVIQTVVQLLQNLGLDRFSAQLGLGNIIGESSLSAIIGKAMFFFIMFTGLISAFEKLGMSEIAEIGTNLFYLSGKVFFGILILMVGNYVSNLSANAIAAGENKGFASFARVGVLSIFIPIALSTMGMATNIVNLAFGLILGAVAVAFALA